MFSPKHFVDFLMCSGSYENCSRTLFLPEAGVVDLELTEPGDGSGRNDELPSNLASSVEFS